MLFTFNDTRYLFNALRDSFLLFKNILFKMLEFIPLYYKKNHLWKYHLIFFFCNFIVDFVFVSQGLCKRGRKVVLCVFYFRSRTKRCELDMPRTRLQSWTNYLEQSKEIKQNWAGAENFDSCFFIILCSYYKSLEKRLDTRLYL